MLALIAGQGGLPAAIARSAESQPLVATLAGFEPEGLTPDISFRIEQLGSFLADLTGRGITDVCFAGAVQRPPIDPSLVDAATMPLVPRMMAAMGQGDDAVLRTVIALFEEAELTVRGADEIAPDLLPDAGVLAGARPDWADTNIARARTLLQAMGDADIGQACAVHKGQAIALEGLFGTDWMLASLANRPDGRGGLLYKGPKPGQDRRIDLPTIGPGTVAGAVTAGLDGIVIEAGGVLVLDRDATVAEAERHGLFLLVEAP